MSNGVMTRGGLGGSELAHYDDATEISGGINTALSAFNDAGIDRQIATARRYPRPVAKVLQETIDQVTMNAAVAASCSYSLPRGGKTISGPSVRLAELFYSNWQHLRASSMVTGDDGKFVTAQCLCLDLQNNVGISIEARRRVTDKNGRRFDDDMIGVTCNAAISIALRNGIFRVIPRVYVDVVLAEAKAVAAGKAESFEKHRATWVNLFVDNGVPARDVYRVLGVNGMEDVTTEHVLTLQGYQTSIVEGLATLDDIFVPPAPEAAKAANASGTKSEKLAAKLAAPGPREPGSDG